MGLWLRVSRSSGGVAPSSEPQGLASSASWTRRAFLQGVLGAAFIAAGAWIIERVYFPRRLSADEIETVAALLETLIPDGEFSGARQTELLANVIRAYESKRQTRRALLEGVHLLDHKAREHGARNFLTSEVRQRAAVVEECARAAAGTLPHFFYRTMRDRAMRFHYSHAVTWKPLRFAHPPQPDGYLNYWQVPDGRG